MNNRDRTVVGKVLDEIAIAESLMQNEDLASFLEDEKLKRAVCMTVINIGELVKNLTESFRLIHAQVPWKAIAGFRDIAAHKYQTLRMEDVYATVSDDFPSLRTMLEAMLTSCGSISGHLVTIPYQIIKHIPTSALLEA